MSEPIVPSRERSTDDVPEQFAAIWRAGCALGNCLQLLIVGMLLELLLFSGTRIGLALRLSVIALLLVGMARSQGWLLLLAIQMSLFFRETSRAEVHFDFDAMLFCYASLALIAYVYCIPTARRRASNRFETKPSSIALRASVLGFSALVSMLLLTYLPITESARSLWLKRSLESANTLWPGATILVVALALAVVFRELTWRQMTSAQAKLYLRSGFMLEHHWDLRLITLRRLKAEKKGKVGRAARV